MAIQPKRLVVFFQRRNGNPYTGGTPSIIIWELNTAGGSPCTTVVVGGEGGSPTVVMDELALGFYKYDFFEYDNEKRYFFRVDGENGPSPNLGSGRFVVGSNEAFKEDIAYAVWEEPRNDHLTGSPETMGFVLNSIFNSTVGSPQGTGPSFTVGDIVAGVWGEILTGSPRPYPPGSSGALLALVTETVLDILNTSDDFGGSPQINIATTVWNTIVTGSPQPFPPGSAGNTIFLTSETVNNIDQAVENLTTCLFGSPKAAPGSPFTPLTVANIVSGVWNELLSGSPLPYPPGSAGNLLALTTEIVTQIQNNPPADLGGSPRINIANTVWNTIVTGSPQPFPPGSAGNTLSLTSETVNNIDQSIENLTTCLFGSPKQAPGSPFTPLTVQNIVSGVWNELLAGSPAPYPTGSAGGLINEIAQSAGLTPAQVTAAVWDVPASDYPTTGSPRTMGTIHTLTEARTVDILDFTELLIAAQYNRTFLDKAAATLTIYASDLTTPLRVFSLRDSTGTPSITEIVDRIPISGSPLVTPPPSP